MRLFREEHSNIFFTMSHRSVCIGLALLGSAEAFTLLGCPGSNAASRAAVSALEAPPPSGFVWADEDIADSTSLVSAPADASETKAPSDVAPVAEVANAEKVKGVVTPTPSKPSKPQPKADKPPPRPKWREGLFAPLVLGAKAVMGEQNLKEMRAAVISKHSKVISEFVDTSESPFGQLVLKRMFEYADKDGNGTLDKEEVRAALLDLGFDWLDERKVAQIVDKADADDNDVIDFEEFVKETPTTLRRNLVKLAKKNGHDLGFLV